MYRDQFGEFVCGYWGLRVNNDGNLNFLSYLTRNIGYKVSFHNKLVVPFGYGNKRSLSVYPFKCVYSHFGFP